jgi:hypothetical protein
MEINLDTSMDTSAESGFENKPLLILLHKLVGL